MVTWDDMSSEALRAAKTLLKEECYRGCVSRAYYSAYCAAADRLVGKGVRFRHGWQNPAHEQLPDLIRTRFVGISRADLWELIKTIRRLRIQRTDADYRPRVNVDLSFARNALRDASYFRRMLERLP
jgi:uncharacterized protein (UPF0332 family)